MSNIHPTAIIEQGADIADNAVIGPYCWVGPNVKIGEGCVLQRHVVIDGHTSLGARSIVFPFAVLGGPPQHILHRGEPTTLTIGEDVVIREFVTMNTGTVAGGGQTNVGDRGFFMTGVHIAHDCAVGSDVIFANNATLGGHVKVEDFAFLGGLCAVHQHSRIGAYSFIGGCAGVAGDVIPYGSVYGNHARLSGLNVVGLKRRGADRTMIHRLRAAYRDVFEGDGAFAERVARARTQYADCDEVMRIITFIEGVGARSLTMPER